MLQSLSGVLDTVIPYGACGNHMMGKKVIATRQTFGWNYRPEKRETTLVPLHRVKTNMMINNHDPYDTRLGRTERYNETVDGVSR